MPDTWGLSFSSLKSKKQGSLGVQTKEKNSVFIAISIHWEFHQVTLCKEVQDLVPGTTAA